MMNEDDSMVPEIVEKKSMVERMADAEIDRAVATARRFPRSIDLFKKTALSMATLDEETAQECLYALPRAGKTIEGPSIRLAEIVLNAWGNLRVDSRVVDDDEKFVTAQATAWDMQTNNAVRIETRRRITDKNGKRFNDDMIGTTGNAAVSIALRNAVFRVVPKAYWKPVYEQAKRVATGNGATLNATREKWFDFFKRGSVSAERVLLMLERRAIEDVTLDDCTKLIGIATALKEGSMKADEVFPPEPLKDGKHSLKKDFGFAAPGNEAKQGAGDAGKVVDPAPTAAEEQLRKDLEAQAQKEKSK